MAAKCLAKLTANFEKNLDEIERFLLEAEAPQTFDALLGELITTVIPSLERFPDIGKPFLERHVHSVEARNGIDAIEQKLKAIGKDGQLREYVLSHYLLLYARFDATVYLLSIRHHRQLSFDVRSLWFDSR